MIDDIDGTIVVTGQDDIEAFRLLALRRMLSLEVKGMKRHGRSARVLANEAMGTDCRTARAAYAAFDKWLAAKYPGRVDPKPLP